MKKLILILGILLVCACSSKEHCNAEMQKQFPDEEYIIGQVEGQRIYIIQSKGIIIICNSIQHEDIKIGTIESKPKYNKKSEDWD